MKKTLMLFALVAFLCAPTIAQKDLEPHEIDAIERSASQQIIPAPTIPEDNQSTKPSAAKGSDTNSTTEKNITPFAGHVEVDYNGSKPSISTQNLNPNWGAYSIHFNDTGESFYSGISGSTSTIGGTGAANAAFINSTQNIAFLSGSNTERMIILNTGQVGVGLTNPTSLFEVSGDNSVLTPVIKSTVTYTGTNDVYAVDGRSIPAPGYGYGGYFNGGYRGVYGRAQGTTYTGSVYGVYGTASNSTTGTTYGVYGTASSSGGGRTYGVYASGDLKVSSQIFIGTNTTQEDAAAGYELVVDGQALVEEVKVELSGSWPDYVFEKEYDLMPLEEVESFIAENGHLPNIPSARQIEKDGGFNLGDTQKRTLEKVEELTLYMIEMKKENERLKKENEEIRALIQELQNK